MPVPEVNPSCPHHVDTGSHARPGVLFCHIRSLSSLLLHLASCVCYSLCFLFFLFFRRPSLPLSTYLTLLPLPPSPVISFATKLKITFADIPHLI